MGHGRLFVSLAVCCVMFMGASACASIAGDMGSAPSGSAGDVTYGGDEARDVWAYDHDVGTWTRHRPSGALPVIGSPAVYDEANGTVLVFSDDFRSMWTYDPPSDTWTLVQPATDVPPARQWGSMVYDPVAHRVILFGGLAGGASQALARDRAVLNDTWAYYPATRVWEELHPSGDIPVPGPLVAMVYDSTLDQVILFSAQIDRAASVSADTWTYDPRTDIWTTVGRLDGPSSRLHDYSLVYVPSTEKVLLFGGASLEPLGGDSVSDLWAFDPVTATWVELDPAGEVPLGRQDAAMVYDSWAGKVLVNGGTRLAADGLTILCDTWSYDPAKDVWTSLESGGDPPAGSFSRGVFDSASGQFLVVGE